jgi:hypothetical protein
MAATTAMSTTTMSEAAMSAEAAMPGEPVTKALMDVRHFSMTTEATMIKTVAPAAKAPKAVRWVVVIAWIVVIGRVVTGHRRAIANRLDASGQRKAQGHHKKQHRQSAAIHRNLRCSSSPMPGAAFATVAYILSKTST